MEQAFYRAVARESMYLRLQGVPDGIGIEQVEPAGHQQVHEH
ncbi:hypothetical protein [Pseudomonas protegens]|nr:hypothetical protein [Pseudomonas protegens]